MRELKILGMSDQSQRTTASKPLGTESGGPTVTTSRRRYKYIFTNKIKKLFFRSENKDGDLKRVDAAESSGMRFGIIDLRR